MIDAHRKLPLKNDSYMYLLVVRLLGLFANIWPSMIDPLVLKQLDRVSLAHVIYTPSPDYSPAQRKTSTSGTYMQRHRESSD